MLIFALKAPRVPLRNFAVMTHKDFKEYQGEKAIFQDQSFCDWKVGLISCSPDNAYNLFLTHIRNNYPLFFLVAEPSVFGIELPRESSDFTVVVERWEGKQVEVVGKKFGYAQSDFSVDYSAACLRIATSPFSNSQRLAADFISYGPRQQTIFLRVPYNIKINGSYQLLENRQRFTFLTKFYEYFRYGEV